VSAKFSVNLEPLHELLSDPLLELVTFCGISGVGKSSLLNKLVPNGTQAVGAVSGKTGQGKQTTSQSFAYPFSRSGKPMLFIVDTPGVQHFGLTHLTKREVAAGFEEIRTLSPSCDFRDCLHVKERGCAVLEALAEKRFSESRYQSYLHILDEIESAKPY
jgi:ribosome biogenesis GTPase / thiamine phosphate phosphatase